MFLRAIQWVKYVEQLAKFLSWVCDIVREPRLYSQRLLAHTDKFHPLMFCRDIFPEVAPRLAHDPLWYHRISV